MEEDFQVEQLVYEDFEFGINVHMLTSDGIGTLLDMINKVNRT